MSTLYILTSAFILIILTILLRKTMMLPPKSLGKETCITAVVTVGVYVFLDAFFMACFTGQVGGVTCFRFVSLIFYLIYVTLPMVWYLFSQSFMLPVKSRFVRGILFVPYFALMAMILTNFRTQALWIISDEGIYDRGPLFQVFSTLNLFYYALPVIRIFMILCSKDRENNPYLLKVLFFSAIPLIGVVTNVYLIPLKDAYPFQPFCYLVGVLFAYFFMVEQQRSIEEEKHRMELQSALEREMEARLQAQNAQRAKSTFLFNMSHDIRTPLNAIIGFAEIISKNPGAEEEVKNSVEKIKSSGDVLLSLINDVLDLARIESGEIALDLTVRDLNQVIDNLARMFMENAGQAGLQFIVEKDIKNAYVACDDTKMTRIMVNLIGNAIKFTPPGGKIVFSTRQTEDVKEDCAEYEIRVRDTGIGMSKEFKDHVFEAFERERTSTESGFGGTGLGLTIVKKLVDLMGGSITVNSELGKGTEIVLRLCFQVAKPEALELKSKKEADGTDYSGKCLLLVEDNLLNREIACQLLEKRGFRIENAENGMIAVDKVIHSKPGYYDLILMDIQMPVMDGYKATREIRKLENKELAAIPIIAMTANAFAEDREKAFQAGMNEHVAKPFDIEKLMQVMKQYLK